MGIRKLISKNKHPSLYSLIGFLVYYSICISLIASVLHNDLWPWPFKGNSSLFNTYKNVGVYLPAIFFAWGSTIWLKTAGLSIYDGFAWHNVSPVFYIGLVISIGYSVYMFAATPFVLRGVKFWPPIFLLSLFNAITEETVYRFVFYQLLKKNFKTPFLPNLFQALAYALPHYWIGGSLMSLYAFIYGLVLGVVVEKNKSVTPGIVCHFCIDIGNIGLPLLIKLNPISLL